jgi:hypothetical protein
MYDFSNTLCRFSDVLANNAVAIFMVNVFGGESGSSYIDLIVSNELEVKPYLPKQGV